MATFSELTQAYLNVGALGFTVIAFFFLVFYVIKEGKDREEKARISYNEREEKLYKIIDSLQASLTSELPLIRNTLEDIKERVFHDK